MVVSFIFKINTVGKHMVVKRMAFARVFPSIFNVGLSKNGDEYRNPVGVDPFHNTG
jgi:hypothetical protein